MSSFNTALSGLNAAQTDLDVTGHNIANASTVGFKQSRAEFADIYANSLYDVSSTAPGRGVRVSRVAQQFSQGTVDFTGNNMDLALNGNGFFIVQDGSGREAYTRAGQFGLDREGYMVTADGEYLQAFKVQGDGTNNTNPVFNTGATDKVQVPLTSGSPKASSKLLMDLNLDANAEAVVAGTDPDFDPTNADSYTSVTSSTLYDSVGASYSLTSYFRKEDDGTGNITWKLYNVLSDANGNQLDPTGSPPTYTAQDLGFKADGTWDTSVTLSDLDYSSLTLPSGGTLGKIKLDLSNSTQYGQPFSVNELTQDGYTAGQLSGVDFDQSGVIFARFTNGSTKVLGQVALADFRNPQGLRQLGDTQWGATYAAGDVKKASPGTSGLGVIQAGANEQSNVDLAKQLVQLIIAQRNYQANAKTIETANQITQTMVNIR